MSILAIGQWDYRFKFLDRNTFDDCTHSDLSPIPLTTEWLERFGFETHPNFSERWFWNHYGYSMTLADDGDWNVMPRVDDSLVVAYCRYVHQLQNLYFALTGTELELKP